MRRDLTIPLSLLVVILAGCVRPDERSIEERISRVERGLIREYGDPPWRRMQLAERMAYHRVPGLSIAFVNRGGIEWTREYGVLEAGRTNAVTAETLFQAASIGKMLVAAAALHHVEQRLLLLDEDVNCRLTSWRVPENEFTAKEKVTLRRLLSHSAGITVSGFRGYAQGEPVPTLNQVLDGESPANSPPIRVDTVPGTGYRYSGGGYMVVQQLLMDVCGQPFPEIMRDTILKPWGLEVTTFESPLPKNRWEVAASGHRGDGRPIPGKWHTYPEMGSGASVWSTPSDLARYLIGVMRAYAGQSDSVLSQPMAARMLTPQVETRALGPVVGDDGGDRFYFMHPGGNEGFRCVAVAYPKKGQGVVIMTNSDNGEALWREILNSVSVEYGWVK